MKRFREVKTFAQSHTTSKGKSIIVFCPYKVFSKATDKGLLERRQVTLTPNGVLYKVLFVQYSLI